MIAIVSDIHANNAALKAVLKDIEEKGCREVLCLGDIVGYGPNPEECLSTAIDRFALNLCGNHEWATINGALGFNHVAKEAIDWTRRTLAPKWYSSPEKKAAWEYLKNLPMKHERGKFLFVHASPANPTEEYLLRTDVDEILGQLTPKLQRAFDMTRWITFVGHTHYPGVFTEDAHFLTLKDLDDLSFRLQDGKKAIINVGSVGQPRDSDNRACYVTLHRGVVTYHRIEYDIEATYNYVLSTQALDKSLGERLLTGT